jgi:hypothetical protein
MSKKKSSPLPDYLKLTPEKIAKIREQQDRLRAQAQARGRLSPEARQMQLGMAHEKSARTDVEMLEAELRDSKESDPDKVARLDHARSRLAEALGQQGRYNEAAEVEPGEEKQAHYEAMWDAVWRDDDETCPCEPFIDGDLSLTHDHVAEEVISQKHGNKRMPAIRCNSEGCGFINVRPLTLELQQRQRAQTQAADLMRGESAERLRQGARELLSEFHDRRVLRR